MRTTRSPARARYANSIFEALLGVNLSRSAAAPTHEDARDRAGQFDKSRRKGSEAFDPVLHYVLLRISENFVAFAVFGAVFLFYILLPQQRW